MKKKLLNILVILAMVFVFVVPNVSASDQNVDPSLLDSFKDDISKTSEILDEEQKEFFTNKIRNLLKENNGKSLGKEKASLNIDTDKIDFSGVKLLKYENNDTFSYMVSMPVILENSHEFSNVTFVFDNKKKFLSTLELYLTENKEGFFNITQYMDGEEKVNLDTDVQFETVEEFKNNQPEISPYGFDINFLASCLGISVALATIIASTCAVACFFSAGLGCGACLAFVAGFNIGGGITCFAEAWR